MKYFKTISILLISLVMCSCVGIHQPQFPAADSIEIPTPVEGNTAKYMCPFTSDDTICEWVSSGIGAKAGASIGAAIGAYAGQKALEQIPFVGGFIGQKVGQQIGREIAIASMGGMDSIKEGSDLSFNNIRKLSIYIYAKHSTHEEYADVVSLMGELYPEFKTQYMAALISAPKKRPVFIDETAVPTSVVAVQKVVIQKAAVTSEKSADGKEVRFVIIPTQPQGTFKATDKDGKPVYLQLEEVK